MIEHDEGTELQVTYTRTLWAVFVVGIHFEIMSTEELVNLIQKNLEEDGILAQIRAKLLSSVVGILNNQEPQPLNQSSKSLRNFASTKNG